MATSISFIHRHRKSIAQVITAVYLANPLLVTAQVILNANTPNDGRRAFVDQTQSGITKVNIASPNKAGLSHNTYQQFDVPKTGVVLNNGATNSNTRIAGWVEGNPNLLPGKEAKLILNEVVGAKPSELQGFLEVAGKKADVIIANEYGVNCNGCGFINTERATLTTGKPAFNSDGSLEKLRVTQGQVHIGSEGLQASGSRLDILSHYANVQGAIHADQINVVTGNNEVDYANGQVSRLPAPVEAATQGLDVGQLGGMYANQITLMATGQGVGVNLEGQLLGAGQVTIQSDGRLQHKGYTQGDSGVRIEADELAQTGHLQSQQSIQVQSVKLNNSGTLQAGQQVLLAGDEIVQAGAIQAREIQIKAVGNIDNSGTLTAGAGGLGVQTLATLENRTTGRMHSQAEINLQAAQLNNAGQIMAKTDVHLHAQDLQNNAHVQAEGQLTAQVERIQNNATLLASGLTVTSQTLNNSGRIEAQKLTLQALDAQSTLTNSGQIAGDNIQIQGQSRLDNTGKISTAVEAKTTADQPHILGIQTGQLNNNGGQIIAQNRTEIQAAGLDNRSGNIATIDGALHIQSNTLDNRSGQILQQGSTRLLHLQSTGALHNGSGQIEGQGQTLTIEASELSNNSGQIQHTAPVMPGQTEPSMTVKVTPSANGNGQLQNIQGTFSATGHLLIQAQAMITDTSDPRRSQSTSLQFMDKTVAQSGSAPSGDGYDWQADIAANEKTNAAKAEADQKAAQAQVAAQQLTQANILLSQAQTQKTNTAVALIQAQSDLSAAQIQASAAQAAAKSEPQNTALAKAAKAAQDQVNSAQNEVNQVQISDQQAQTALTQTQANAQVAQASKMAAESASATAQTAFLAAQADIKTVTEGNRGSSVSATDATKPADIQLSAPTLPLATSSGALIQAGRSITLTLGTGGLDNRQGRLQGQDIQVQSQGDIWAGQIHAKTSLSLQADHIEAELGIQAKTTRINAQVLNNEGRIEGTQELQIEAQRIDNSGTLRSANTQLHGKTAGNPTDLVLNNRGLVQGDVNLNIDAAQLLNNGTLSSGQAQIRGAEQLENKEVIFSTGHMTLQGQDIVNNQGRIYSMGDLTVEGVQAGQTAGSVFNYAGRIEAQGDVNINAGTLTNRAVLPSVNQRGFVEHIRDGGNIITRATDTFNADGKKAEIIAGKKLNITAKTLNNDYGILSAWHQVNIAADTLNNTAYGAIQTENMVVKAACYNCHQTVRYADSWGGRIESGAAAQLRALVINNKTTDTRDGFAGLSKDPRVIIVDERSGTQSPLTQAFIDRFGIVTGPGTDNASQSQVPLPGPRLLSDNLVLTAYGRFDFSRFELPNGKTGLFQLADPASPYLIQGRTDLIPRETGAQNTSYNQFLGSDYLMTRLGLIPGGVKRLGDAWYETQLVQEQLYALSGRRYLIAGSSSDYDLMRNLMDAGLLAQAQLHLVAGDPLSPEQQQALKQDMVWPEWQDIAGQRVLVPKVYLAQRQGESNKSGQQVGALIAGQSVGIQTTELNQSHGHIAAGSLLSINAKGAVQGLGSYTGGTSVAVVAGNIDLKNASVQSAGWLKLQTTQGDLNLAATQIKAVGDTTLQSADQLNLLAQKHEAHVVRGDGSKKDEVKYETTRIAAGGNLTLESKNNLTLQGSSLSAGKDLELGSTDGNVDLQALKNTTSSTIVSRKGFFRKKTATTADIETIEGTKLQAAGDVQVLAGRDLNAESLQLQAGGNAQLGSLGQLDIGSEQAYSRTQTGNDVRQSLQTKRTLIEAEGSVNVYGQESAVLSATDINAGRNAQITSQGAVILDANTDTEQHNWTTSSTSRKWYGKKTTTTTQHETLDKSAEVTKIVGNQVQVRGNTVSSYGAQLTSTQDDLEVETQGSIKLYGIKDESTVKTNSQTRSSFIGFNYSKSASSSSSFNSQSLGTTLLSEQNMSLHAGEDLVTRAAQVHSGDALSVTAGRDLIIGTDTQQRSDQITESSSRTNGFSSKSTTTETSITQNQVIASNFDGKSVSLSAGQDLNVKGSNVLADQSLNLSTGRNLTIDAAQNTQSSSSFTETTKTGLISNGGLSITIGKQQQSLDQGLQQTTASASTVGSIGGNVTINAGRAYTQTGSDVLTPQGNIAITAQKVDINEARETGSQSAEQKFKQSGITVAITSPVLSSLQTVQSQVKAAGNTNSDRMKLLSTANTAMNLKQAADAVKAGQGDENGMVKTGAQNPDGSLKTNADGTPETTQGNAADKVGGIGISISMGSSSSKSKQNSSADSARGSDLAAGGSIIVQATGAGEESNLTVQGSDIKSSGTTSLKADNQVNLLASQNTFSENNSNQSKSGSVGVAIQFGNSGGGVGYTASASKATGQGAGNGVTYTNTQVAGSGVNIESGSDTTLKGAVVNANQVTVNVGGNLNIQSQQDTNQYKESSKSAGGSIMVGTGVSGNINLAKSSINSNFQSVGEQSAIKAGDAGFQVSVEGSTTLTGANITSTQAAIDNNKNSFQTGATLTTTDLQNKANFDAKSVSIGIGTGALPGKGSSAGLSGVGFGSESGSAASTSTAGISGVAGNTQARTGDKETGIGQIFDADKVKKEMEAEVAITQEFGKQMGKGITDYSNEKRKILREKLETATSPEDRASAEQDIKDVNTQERALNILTGALTGMVGSVITKEALSLTAEKMRDFMVEDSKKFAGVVDSTGKVLSNVSGPSDGVRGDGVKVGGTRVDLDLLCGPDNAHCTFEKNLDGTIDTRKPVTFDGRVKPDGTRETLEDFLKSPEGQKMAGATGGIQGAVGTLFGVPYAAGSWQDKLVESFSGTHDFIGGKASGLYDAQGNAARGRSELTTTLQNRWSEIAVLPAAPFAAADGLSPEIWKAIGILLGAGK